LSVSALITQKSRVKIREYVHRLYT